MTNQTAANVAELFFTTKRNRSVEYELPFNAKPGTKAEVHVTTSNWLSPKQTSWIKNLAIRDSSWNKSGYEINGSFNHSEFGRVCVDLLLDGAVSQIIYRYTE